MYGSHVLLQVKDEQIECAVAQVNTYDEPMIELITQLLVDNFNKLLKGKSSAAQQTQKTEQKNMIVSCDYLSCLSVQVLYMIQRHTGFYHSV